jgi:predicted tellurium resistance membrane protein TerC
MFGNLRLFLALSLPKALLEKRNTIDVLCLAFLSMVAASLASPYSPTRFSLRFTFIKPLSYPALVRIPQQVQIDRRLPLRP